jgi:hypothetical protein
MAQARATLGERVVNDCELVLLVRVEDEHFQAMRRAALDYLCACFEVDPTLDDDALLSAFDAHVHTVANRTPNGLMIPKKEFEREFNDVHAATSRWLATLGLDALFYQLECPLDFRVVSGVETDAVQNRPYSSSKTHLDLWSGDPGDHVIIAVPVFGDPERTSVEYFEPPDALDESYIRVLDGYDGVQALLADARPYPVRPQVGCALFVDALVPHRTVRRGGSVRVNVEIRVRRTTTPDERAFMEANCAPARLLAYMSTPEWHEIGISKLLTFLDMNADAKRGIFPTHRHGEGRYRVVDRR